MDAHLRPTPLELWGGVECTFNRVGERYFSQLEWNGHSHRLSDLDLFADIGFRALRYPVIWDALAPDSPDAIDWAFPDERLNRLRELSVRPIAGLVHHGSGPRYANIGTPDFAHGLAHFAGQVARRYPWLEDYTPVNEPLTTARFCGLYGHWHPHGHDNASFVRILLNECRATVEAMQAIREVNSQARLIQTDDLGRIYSTPRLEYQAHFENERRWLSFDLLCGHVNREHIMWDYLIESGISPRELDWFCENPCPPDIIGINHYPTSDRFLDENIELYPGIECPGNGRDVYVDVEAVRVLPTPPGGFRERLCETWTRYGIPIAITEAHLGCTREEQVRWTAEAWQTAQDLKKGGVDMRAVTAWSLLGAWNWNTLVTRDVKYYEPGVFDVRSGTPRPTALAHLLRDLGRGDEHDHPALDQLGWWRRPQRMLGAPPISHRLHSASPSNWTEPDKSMRPLLIIGKNGALGNAFAQECDLRGLPYYLLSRKEIDLCDLMSIEMVLNATRPWAVINAAGYSSVDGAESDPDACYRLNTESAVNLAQACVRHRIRLTCFSSDLVFDGQKQTAYFEDDALSPLNVYGKSKAMMEEQVMETHPSALVVRASALFGPHCQRNFVSRTLDALGRGESASVANDVVISPTYAPDLVTATLDLMVDHDSGIWHLANEGALSWYDFVRMVSAQAGISGNIHGAPWRDLNYSAPRPTFSALGSGRGQILPSIDDALARYQHRN
jgi:dTDP-4-dehydrorhamnose reductase